MVVALQLFIVFVDLEVGGLRYVGFEHPESLVNMMKSGLKKKVNNLAIAGAVTQKTKMAANFKLAGQFWGFIFKSIQLTEN